MSAPDEKFLDGLAWEAYVREERKKKADERALEKFRKAVAEALAKGLGVVELFGVLRDEAGDR